MWSEINHDEAYLFRPARASAGEGMPSEREGENQRSPEAKGIVIGRGFDDHRSQSAPCEGSALPGYGSRFIETGGSAEAPLRLGCGGTS